MAQIFGEVSPAMHEEFALKYETEVMARCGLNYYGCCEPLHNKMHILAKAPRLRKVSISPWCDVEKAEPVRRSGTSSATSPAGLLRRGPVRSGARGAGHPLAARAFRRHAVRVRHERTSAPCAATRSG